MVTRSLTRPLWQRRLPAVLLGGFLLAGAGCKQLSPSTKETPQTAPAPAAAAPAPTPPNDQEIANDIQSRIDAESALNGQDIKVSVNGGTATLNGTVNNDAARALAAADSGAAAGVRTVINNLTVAPQRAVKQTPPARAERRHREPSPDEQAMVQPTQAPPASAPEAAHPAPAPAPPPRPPAPVVRTVSVPAGTTLPIRLTDALDTATTQTGQQIHGTLADDIIAENMVAIPRGTAVTGRVVEAKDATHFSGSSSLTLELTQVDLKGGPVAVSTAPFSEQGKGRGKNTAMKAGGGAALGAIIGAIAGGGKGAAIGAASGGGLGAGVNAVTRGEQVKIPAETLINFKLQSPVSVSTSHSANGPAVRTFGDPNADSSQPQ
jgi:BON domain-containing protein